MAWSSSQSKHGDGSPGVRGERRANCSDWLYVYPVASRGSFDCVCWKWTVNREAAWLILKWDWVCLCQAANELHEAEHWSDAVSSPAERPRVFQQSTEKDERMHISASVSLVLRSRDGFSPQQEISWHFNIARSPVTRFRHTPNWE